VDYRKLASQARGASSADFVIKNAKVPNLFSGEIEEADVAVSDGLVVGVGAGYCGREEFDAAGKILVPGFIEAHCHIESTMLTPRGFAELILPHGTTTVFADPHEIANTSSFEGLRFMCEASKGLPVDIYLNAPSCVPASPFETPHENLKADAVAQMFAEGTCHGLGEMMNYPGVVGGDRDTWEKILASRGQPCNGHAPCLTGKELNAYLLSRCNSDHECSSYEEALDKLRRGCWVMLRQGATEHNLAALAPLVAEDERRASRCMLVSDDLTAAVLHNEGHLDRILRLAVRSGISPVSALRMVTLNPAEFNRIYDVGAIAPGYRADMVLLDNLEDFNVLHVWKNGRAAEFSRRESSCGVSFPRVNGNGCTLTAEDLRIPARGRLRVIEAVPGEVITREQIIDGAVVDGEFTSCPSLDLAKMAVVNRNTTQRRIGRGFVTGLGLQRGALGSSVAHDAHNFSIVGMDDQSMLTAFDAIRKKGGLVAADGSEVLFHLPLPIAGLMSDLPPEELLRNFSLLLDAAKKLGTPLPNPFMVLSFLSLSVIPSLKLTDQGYVNLAQGGLVPLSV